MALTLDRTDAQLRDRVRRQLESTREVDAHAIAVSARDGHVTLTGRARSLPEKLAAEDAVKRLYGVRAIVNEIRVDSGSPEGDVEIARLAGASLRAGAGLPDTVTASVKDGIVVLEGTVRWLYQRFAAETSVAYLPGVCGVENRITLSASTSSPALQEEVEQALLRTAGLDWKRIRVSADGGVVTLDGDVFSLTEKESAERAAWANPGVSRVDSRLDVVPRRWW